MDGQSIGSWCPRTEVTARVVDEPRYNESLQSTSARIMEVISDEWLDGVAVQASATSRCELTLATELQR
jgi:hypothetical protein